MGDSCYNLPATPGKSENLKMLEPKKIARKEQNQGRSTTEIMEQHIWKEFPEDLFGSVLARLPIATFFRFRSVCRKWNSMLNSQSFHQQCAEVPQLNPWVYTTTPGSRNIGSMYDPTSKKWHHPIIHAFPEDSTVGPVASAGGVVCFLDMRHMSQYVRNPITKSCRKLPSVKYSSGMVVEMSMEKSRGGYKIILLNWDGEYEVYDSRGNTWSPGSVSSNIKLFSLRSWESQTVSIGSTHYFSTHSDPDGIVSYDMVTREWKQYVIPTPLHLSYYAIAECEGHLLLVGLLTENTALACVCLWELQKTTNLWKEIDRMPNTLLCLEFYGKQVYMSCLGIKGLVMVECPATPAWEKYDSNDSKWCCILSIFDCFSHISFHNNQAPLACCCYFHTIMFVTKKEKNVPVKSCLFITMFPGFKP